MGTKIRPEITKNSPYYISKHRYYELKHFVQQYPDWVKEIRAIDSLVHRPVDYVVRTNDIPNPVSKAAEDREFLQNKIDLLTKTASDTDRIIGIYILQAIINNESYDSISTRTSIPCCRDVYYDLYRKFFWLLDKARG